MLKGSVLESIAASPDSNELENTYVEYATPPPLNYGKMENFLDEKSDITPNHKCLAKVILASFALFLILFQQKDFALILQFPIRDMEIPQHIPNGPQSIALNSLLAK